VNTELHTYYLSTYLFNLANVMTVSRPSPLKKSNVIIISPKLYETPGKIFFGLSFLGFVQLCVILDPMTSTLNIITLKYINQMINNSKAVQQGGGRSFGVNCARLFFNLSLMPPFPPPLIYVLDKVQK